MYEVFLIGNKYFITKCQPELPSVGYNFECLKHNTCTRKIKTNLLVMKTFNMCLLYLFDRYLLMYLYLIFFSTCISARRLVNPVCLILLGTKTLFSYDKFRVFRYIYDILSPIF